MDFDKSRIERLKRALYSRDENVVPKEKRTPVPEKEYDVPSNWGAPKSFDLTSEDMVKRDNSFFNKFLVISLIFFFISLGLAVFIFFGGLNMISSNNLDLKITAPSSISSGEEFDMGINLVNGNRTDLEETNLFIDYPEGAENPSGDNEKLTHEKINLGVISKGGTKNYSIRALLFGEKDSVKTFSLRIEYKVKGSNATFSKEKKYEVAIGSSPLLLNVSYPKEINSGQEVTFSIDVTSNSPVVLKNALIKIDYPYGFTYERSNIKPLRNNSVWNIGDLKNGDKKTLNVTGVLVGQNMEDRSFRISAGTPDSSSPNDFDTSLAQTELVVGIRKSFFGLTLAAGSNAVIKFGQPINVAVKWQNTLPDQIVNSRIIATVGGNALDRNAVLAGDGGFFESVENQVVWDKNSTNNLSIMQPGDESQVSFSVASFNNPVQIRAIKNPHIDLHVVMTGDRTGSDSGSVSSTADLTIKILSTIELTARTWRDSGPFNNTGPIPPKADKETTYTITWNLTNTTNDLKNTTVTAVLPQGVSWKAETSPGTEKISYNPDNRTITWNLSNVPAGVGFNYSPKAVSFKVGLTPSLNQVGSAPLLVNQIGAIATDSYTNTSIETTAPSISTVYGDATFRQGNETVNK
jgi:hypothetical protein